MCKNKIVRVFAHTKLPLIAQKTLIDLYNDIHKNYRPSVKKVTNKYNLCVFNSLHFVLNCCCCNNSNGPLSQKFLFKVFFLLSSCTHIYHTQGKKKYMWRTWYGDKVCNSFSFEFSFLWYYVNVVVVDGQGRWWRCRERKRDDDDVTEILILET